MSPPATSRAGSWEGLSTRAAEKVRIAGFTTTGYVKLSESAHASYNVGSVRAPGTFIRPFHGLHVTGISDVGHRDAAFAVSRGNPPRRSRRYRHGGLVSAGVQRANRCHAV